MAGYSSDNRSYTQPRGTSNFNGLLKAFPATRHPPAPSRTTIVEAAGLAPTAVVASRTTTWNVAGASFSPSDISGLTLWYDPSDAATVTLSGADVTAISGHGGYGSSLTPPVASTVTVGTQNGRATLLFGAGTAGLNGVMAAPWTSSQLSIFCAYNFDDSVSFARGLSLASDDEPNEWESANSMMPMSKENFLFPSFSYFGTGTSPAATIAGSCHVYSAVTTATGVTLADNGTTVATGSKGNTAMSAERFGIGGRATGSSSGDGYRGHIGEVICYNRTLTGPEQTQIVDYLKAKWTSATTPVTASRSTTWNVAAGPTAVTPATRSTTWNVAGSLTAVTPATRSTTWKVAATVSANRPTTWNVLATGGTVYSDDFNRANGALGGSWINDTLTIVSNKAAVTGADQTAEYNQTLTADQWCEADIDSAGGGTTAGLAAGLQVRMSAAGYYYIWRDGSTLDLQRWVVSGSSDTNIGTYSPTTGPHLYRLEANGTTIKVYVDNVQVISVTDSTHTTGHAGMGGGNYIAGTNPTLDNWRAGDMPYVPVGTTPVTPATRSTTWSVAATVTASRSTTWNVTSALTSVTPATRATTWNVIGRIVAARSTTWNTLGAYYLSDEFTGSSIDLGIWDVYDRLMDQFNGEVGAVIPANVRVSSGTLKGDQKFEDVSAGDTTTGPPNPRVVHYTSFQIAQKAPSFLYGDVRVRAMIPGGTGNWPCIWMLGHLWQASQPHTANVDGADWPNGGWWEIDIAEFLSGHRSDVNCALHFITPSRVGSGEKAVPFDATSRFMVYRLVWTATSLTWYVDAEDGVGWRTLLTMSGAPGVDIPNTPGYLIIHTAIGGAGGTPNPATYPTVMEVDYARVALTTPVTPATRSTTWNTTTSVTANRSTTWNVAASLTPVTPATRPTTWTVLTGVTTSRSTTWNALARTVAATRPTTWTVAATVVANTRSTTWAVAATVTASRSTTWNVAGALTQVTATRATTWVARALITANRPTTWTVRLLVVEARSTTWTVTVPVAGVATRATTWQVTVPVAVATRPTTWRTLALVSGSRPTTWNVAGPIITVTAIRVALWSVNRQVAANRQTTWATRQRTSAQRSSTWAVKPSAPQHNYLTLYPDTVMYKGTHRVLALYQGTERIWP